MATTKKPDPIVEDENLDPFGYEKVDVRVPRGGPNDEPNVFISINGVTYLLPRGQVSSVPKFVADEYERSKEAEEAFYRTVDELLEKTKAPTGEI